MDQAIGLLRGKVRLLPHQAEWKKSAEEVIAKLKNLLADTAVDIQHVGSTAIASIHAKPIIDIAVAVNNLKEISPYIDSLEQKGIFCRGKDVSGQMLFVMGNLQTDIRTHHIHVVEYASTNWKNYINLRDYLNAFPEKAQEYDRCKQELARQFSDDRRSYTLGKEKVVQELLKEAQAFFC